MPRISRFKKRVSDRSGFDYFEIELVKEGPYKVGSSERDTPPPSRLPLGGEGDVSSSEIRSNSDFSSIATTNVPTGHDNPIVYITAAGGITPSTTHPWINISGSNAAVTITRNPQIIPGYQGQVLTLQGVGSGVTIAHGNGINMMGSLGSLQISSGIVITFVYTTGGSVWNEASRNRI